MTGKCVTAAAVLVVGGVMGCSAGPSPGDPQGSRLPPGVAQLVLNDTDAGRIEAVRCAPIEHVTAIEIGADPPMVVAAISNIDELALKWIRFHDVNGFTGSYNDGLDGSAQVTITGSMYEISGTAIGFISENPSRPFTAAFAVEVSC